MLAVFVVMALAAFMSRLLLKLPLDPAAFQQYGKLFV